MWELVCGSYIALSEKTIIAKMKVLLLNWRHCTQDRKLEDP